MHYNLQASHDNWYTLRKNTYIYILKGSSFLQDFHLEHFLKGKFSVVQCLWVTPEAKTKKRLGCYMESCVGGCTFVLSPVRKSDLQNSKTDP